MTRYTGKILLTVFVISCFIFSAAFVLSQDKQDKSKQAKTVKQSKEPVKTEKKSKEAPKKAEPIDKKKNKKENLVKELLTDVEKVDQSIQIVKDEIDQTREKKFIPTLLLRLAELYVEKSRLLFYRAKEEAPEAERGQVESPEVKEVKELAIEIYRKILSDYPDYNDIVKVHFFMAHEMRETGDQQGMTEQWEKIVKDYPDSKYRGEALLLLGDYNFDKKRISQAADYYKKIIASDVDPNIANMARYKLAWCHINQDDFQAALKQFEDIAKSAKKPRGEEQEDRLGKSSIVREALIDSILCFTEVKKPQDAIDYYKDLADSEITYAKVLEKLANRYFIKKDLVNSTRLYRELLKISGELEDNIEYMKRVLQFSRDANNREQSLQDVDFLIRNLNRYLHSFRIPEEDKRTAYNQFEVFARDIATKLHLKADETKKAEFYDASAKAYKQYLTLFKDSKYSKDIQFNFAETLYASKKYLDAGEQYETLYKNSKDNKEKSDALYSAVSAYFDAIKDPKSLDKVQLIDARQGFIKTATQYIQEFPKSEKTAELRFAIGRTHYDLEEYDEAIQSFVKFISDYPDNKLTVDAANLVLDSYNQRKDYAGMVQQGKLFLADKRIRNDKFKQQVSDLVKKTEFVMIQDQAGKGKLAVEQGDFAKDFLQYSQRYRGTELGEKALYNAFQSYRKKNDRKLTFISGTQFIIQYPNSDLLRDIYPTLGSIAFEVSDYDKACYYFESYYRKFPQDSKALELLGKAAQLRTLLSDSREAISDYQKLLATGKAQNPSEVYSSMASNYERMQNYSEMASALKQANSLGLDTIESNAELAYAYFRIRDFQGATEAASQAIKISSSKGAGRLTQNEISALAHAAFINIEIKFVNFENVAVTKGGSNESKLVERKNRLLQDMEKSLVDISSYKETKWIIATIFRIGQAYADFANFLSLTSIPSSLNSDQRKEYKQILGQKTAFLKKKSKETLGAALSKAYSLNVFNNWVKSCYLGYYVKDDLKIRQNIAINTEDRKQIEESFSQLLADPTDTKNLNKIALLYMRNGDFGIAKMILLRSNEIKSGNASTLNSLGVAHWYMGEDQDAYIYFAKAITASPGFTASKANLAAMYYEYGNTMTAQMSIKQLKGLETLNFNAINVIPPVKKLIGR